MTTFATATLALGFAAALLFAGWLVGVLIAFGS